jgi:hypothetical protein
VANAGVCMSENSTVAKVKDYWKHADEGLRDEFARMRTGFAFYAGDQWDATDLAKLAAEKRPALTINLSQPAGGYSASGQAGYHCYRPQRRTPQAGGCLYADSAALHGYERQRL